MVRSHLGRRYSSEKQLQTFMYFLHFFSFIEPYQEMEKTEINCHLVPAIY
jgi:hypothetical protein